MEPLNDVSNARYYANPSEQQILIQGLQRYFSLPERSQNRNKIAKEVSQFLRCFSSHWTHRAVRLWFNNNKHAYFTPPNSGDPNSNYINNNQPIPHPNIAFNLPVLPRPIYPQIVQLIPRPSFPIPSVQPNVQMTPYSSTPNIHSNNCTTKNRKSNQKTQNPDKIHKKADIAVKLSSNIEKEKPKVQQFVLPQISLSSTIKNKTQIQSNQEKQTFEPAYQSKPFPKIPAPQISTPIIPVSSQLEKNPIKIQFSSNSKQPQVKILPPIQISSLVTSHSTSELPKSNKPSLPTEGQLTSEIKSLLVNIRNTPETSSQLLEQIDQFDELCRNYRSRFGFLSPQIINPSMKFVRFPITRPQLPSFSTSNDTGADLDNGFLYNEMNGSTTFNLYGSMSTFGSNFSLSGLSPSPSLTLSNTDMLNEIHDNRQHSAIPISSFYMCNSNIGSSLGSFGSLSNLLINDIKENTLPDFNSVKQPSTTETSSNQSPSSPCSMSTSIDGDISETPNLPSINRLSSRNDFNDQYSSNQLLQTRSFKDTYIPYHECAAISQNMDVAAYAFRQIEDQKLVICFTRANFDQNIDEDGYSSDKMHESWKTFPVDVKTTIESMVIDSHFAYLLTNQEIIKTSLDNYNFQQSFEVSQTTGDKFLSIFDNNNDTNYVFTGFTSSPEIGILINNKDDECHFDGIKTRYRGISAITSLGTDKLVCGVPLSGTSRLVNFEGKEIRAFVGHCGSVLSLSSLMSNDENYLFASRADDNTVRVWDIRDRLSVYQITSSSGPLSHFSSSYCSFLTACGSSQFLVLGFHNQIGIVDLRKDFAKPLLAISTGDYDPYSMCFNQNLNSIAMFGDVLNITTKDSMLFVGNDGQSQKRIFRTYDNLLV